MKWIAPIARSRSLRHCLFRERAQACQYWCVRFFRYLAPCSLRAHDCCARFVAAQKSHNDALACCCSVGFRGRYFIFDGCHFLAPRCARGDSGVTDPNTSSHCISSLATNNFMDSAQCSHMAWCPSSLPSVAGLTKLVSRSFRSPLLIKPG